MSKDNIFFTSASVIYLLAFLLAWDELQSLFADPLLITSFDSSALSPIINIVIVLSLITLPAALLITLAIDRQKRFVMYAAGGLTSLSFFYDKPLIALVLIIGTFISYALFDRNSSNDLKNQISPRPIPTFRKAIKSLMFIMALVISLGYYISFNDETLSTFTFQIPDKLIDSMIQRVGQASDSPIFQKDKQAELINEQFESRVKPQVLEQLKSAGIVNPNEIERQLTLAKLKFDERAKEQFDNISKSNSPNSLANEVKSEVQKNIDKLVADYREYLPVIFTISLFALFQFLDPFVSYLASIVLFLIVTILRKADVIHLEKVSKEVEVLRL